MAAALMRTALKGSGRSMVPRYGTSSSSLRRLTGSTPTKAQIQVQHVAQQPPPARADELPPLASTATAMTQPPISDRPVVSRTYFDATGVLWMSIGAEQSQDPNKAKLGKTLRILQERLPTLLQSPLPAQILAPNISLHLFPTTHPHLPTVSGRVAYSAALWTSPIAWNRVPIVGNVKLEILAERVTSEPLTFLPRRPGAIPEQLVVRWCEKRKPSSAKKRDAKQPGGDDKGPFTGLFIFDFDSEGRVLSHTIEQAQEGGDWEKGMGAKFVGLTDWLLGGMKNPGEAPIPMFERKRLS